MYIPKVYFDNKHIVTCKPPGYIIIGHHVYHGNNFMMKSEDVHHCWKSFNTTLWYSDKIA